MVRLLCRGQVVHSDGAHWRCHAHRTFLFSPGKRAEVFRVENLEYFLAGQTAFVSLRTELVPLHSAQSLMPSFEGNLLTQRHEIWSQETRDSRLSYGKTRSLYLTWAWISTRLWQTDRWTHSWGGFLTSELIANFLFKKSCSLGLQLWAEMFVWFIAWGGFTFFPRKMANDKEHCIHQLLRPEWWSARDAVGSMAQTELKLSWWMSINYRTVNHECS